MTDKNKIKNKIYSTPALITLAIVCFANPTVWLVDLIPDFIGCFIIAAALLSPSDRAPFFAEARSAFLKLGVVSLAKIPGFFVLLKIRSFNVADYDISALLTFSFAVIEAYLFTVAINNLFSAFYYLGERGECIAPITPFKLSSDPNSLSKMKPETLKVYTLVFTYAKLAAGSLPEMLQLSKTDDFSSYIPRFNARLLYPIVLLTGIVAVLVMGVFFAKLFGAYIRSIRTEGRLYSSCDALISDGQRAELNLKIQKRETRHSLRLVAFGALFLFSLRLDNFQEVNLIPTFAFGVLMLLAVSSIEKYGKQTVLPTVASILFIASEIYYRICEMEFLDKFSFDLLATSKKAIAAYPTVMNGAFISAVTLIFLIISVAVFLFGFVKRKLLICSGEDERTVAERRRSHGISIAIWCFAGVLSAVSGLLETVFRYYSELTVVTRGYETVGVITSGLVPWFGTLVFLLNIVFLCVGVYMTGKVKDDLDIYLN